MILPYLTSRMQSPVQGNLTHKVIGIYVVFSTIGYWIFDCMAGRRFTSVLTLGSLLHCLSLVLLLVQVSAKGGAGAAGVSARALFLEALSLCMRLSSTLWLNGYLPADASGDWAFQVVDLASLCVAGYLLNVVLNEKRNTYQEEEDTLSLLPLIAASLVLGVFLHSNMDERPVFDALWMSSLWAGAAAVLPQLALIGRTGGCLEPLTSHRIAAAGLGRGFSLAFMWLAREDITCIEWLSGFNHARWSVLIAHCLHLLLLFEFAYMFIKSEAMASQSSSLICSDKRDIYIVK